MQRFLYGNNVLETREQTSTVNGDLSGDDPSQNVLWEHGATLCHVAHVVFSTIFTLENGLVVGEIGVLLEPSLRLQSV